MARRTFLLVSLVLMAGGLAGCAGRAGDAPAEAQTLPTAGEGLAGGASLAIPEWAVGDAWTYDVEGRPSTYVVTSETTTDWVVETDSEERSFADLRDDVSRLGPQRKSDLAGSQGQDRVEFFRWPLEAGKTWSATWDQEEVAVTVLEVAAGKASLEARFADGTGDLAYRYTYDAQARWFSELTRFGRDESVFSLRLTQAVRNWTGTVVRWTLAEVVADSSPPTSQPPMVAGPFDVPAGTTDIWADYHFTCTGTGGFSVAIEPLNDGLAAQHRMEDTGPCIQVDWSGPAITAPEAGRWAFLLTAGGETVAYDYTLLLRTRVDVPFPS